MEHARTLGYVLDFVTISGTKSLITELIRYCFTIQIQYIILNNRYSYCYNK